jgi:hypothetical protein
MRIRYSVLTLGLVALLLTAPRLPWVPGAVAQNTALNRTTTALLTNKSGGALVFGDVVVLDNTNANGFTTTTTAGLSTRGMGVILDRAGIANNATGMVAIGGWCPRVNLNTAATVGQFLKSHTVAGQGTPHSSPQVEGDFGIALTASATPPAILFTVPNGPIGGSVTNTGTLTSGKLLQGNGGVDATVNTTTATVTKLTAGVPSAATAGTDYVVPTSLSGATVATDETTTSGSYVDLATAGPSVTITTVGTVAVVWMAGRYYNTTAGQDGSIAVVVSGATTVAAADGNAAVSANTVAGFAVPFGRIVILTGLTPGSNTFKLQYKRSAGTAHFLDRTIAVFAP